MKDFLDLINNTALEIDKFLDDNLPNSQGLNLQLFQAMRYSSIDAGKKIRAFLVIESARFLSVINKKKISQVKYDELIAVASAIEAIHSYSLIHDDLPAMDNSSKRRGKPSNHIRFDEHTAILAGDALQDDSNNVAVGTNAMTDLQTDNCVAVGLSAGFLEPLEASALVLVELSAKMISEQLPVTRSSMDIIAKRFNETFLYRWDKIIDFLKLHYILSKRVDNSFWSENRDPNSIPQSLKDLMALWQHRSPTDNDFTSNNEIFPAASYQYVLYGMGFKSDYSHAPHLLNDWHYANQQFAQNKKLTVTAISNLPTNRELLKKVKQYGFTHL